LLAWYTLAFAHGALSPAVEAMFTICPPPCAFIACAASCAIHEGGRADFTPITASHCARVQLVDRQGEIDGGRC